MCSCFATSDQRVEKQKKITSRKTTRVPLEQKQLFFVVAFEEVLAM
jgi:hypothetical protein